jgi:hypothetical protein
MIIFGGCNDTKRLNSTYIFDIENKKWIKPLLVGESIDPRSYHTSIIVEQVMYTFGGYDGHKRLNELYKLERVLPSLFYLCLFFIKKK